MKRILIKYLSVIIYLLIAITYFAIESQKHNVDTFIAAMTFCLPALVIAYVVQQYVLPLIQEIRTRIKK